VPVIPEVAMPEHMTGEQWFGGLSDEEQLHIMGPTRLELYQSGQVQWSDLAQHTHNDVWGGSIQPTPVRDLTGGTPVTKAA
jgi:hypothetical protein